MSDETSTHQGQGEIIIVKKVQGGGGGHHGGAWKIAYADFVTAMMAFFLVMWLVNAANEDTKASVASYFNPIKLTDSSPASKDVKKNAESKQGEQSQESSDSDGEEKTKGEAAAEGSQEQSTVGEESENSEADYFENPYAVLSEIVLDAAEESNISEKGDGGAQNSGSATGASGGEAYRDPFDPDFWTKQISNNPNVVEEEPKPTEELAEGQNVAERVGEFDLDLGAGDVYDKAAGAGDEVKIGAGLSDHDTGGRKSGLSEFDGEKGGKEFAEEGSHLTDLVSNEKTSSTLPEGSTPVDEIDPTKLATLFEKGTKQLDNLIEQGATDRLTSEEAEELLELAKEAKEQKLGPDKQERMDELLEKNEAARQTAQKVAELQKTLEKYKETIVEMELQEEGLTDSEILEQEIKLALGGSIGKLAEGLSVAPAEGGLLLSMTDQSNIGMFNIGSAVPKRETILLMDEVGRILNERGGSIVVRGHTDARPFSSGGNDNWRLSMARAHSAYFMLVRGGIPEDRIVQVSGFADRRLKVPDDPFSEQNRRIEILIEAGDS